MVKYMLLRVCLVMSGESVSFRTQAVVVLQSKQGLITLLLLCWLER